MKKILQVLILCLLLIMIAVVLKLEQAKYLWLGKIIDMTANNTTITSDNFSVDKYGNMSCNNAEIKGGEIELTSQENNPKITFKYPNDSSIYSQFFATGFRHYYNNEAKVILYSNVPTLILKDDSFGEMTLFPSAIRINDEIGNTLISMNMNNNDGNITCVSLTQTSKEESKKNFEKLQNALDIIKATDIYKYNMKTQKDGDKKHIGFVIGDKYKYSEEITSENNDGVDTYSMVSVAYKAIQEQQEMIEQLQKEIKELKGEK